MVGTTVSHYRILKKLGEGGMGVVYKAEDTRLRRTVALKFLPRALESHDTERARFLQEAQAASALNHPNVCTVYDIGAEGDTQFIVMEYVEGSTLSERIAEGKLPSPTAVAYAIQIGEALEEAHAHGIIHRDVKAENIMLTAKGQVKVMDFGLAKLKGSLKLTKTSGTVGTLAYMAPEQIQGADVDVRSDIFSFGIVLYEMLTGSLPFRGEHEAALVYSIVNEDPVPIQRHLPDASSELVHVLDRALEKEPEDRYQTVHDMVIDLRRLKKKTAPVSAAVRGVSAAEMQVATEQRPESSGRRRMRPALLLTAGTVIAAAAIGLIMMMSADRKPFEQFEIRRLTRSGVAGDVSISPDGKVVSHSEFREGMQSCWIRQVATGSAVEVGPPFKGYVLGTTFTPDGEFLLYGVLDQADHPRGAIYRVPVLGGQPRKLIENVESTVAVSTDGSRLAFVRDRPTSGEEALIVCSSDGGDERTLVVKDSAEAFLVSGPAAPAWSPDDQLIALSAAIHGERWAEGILLVSVRDGTQSWLGATDWETVNRVVWYPDGSGLVAIGARGKGSLTQLWWVDYPEGSVRRITSDLNGYLSHSIGITSDGRTIAAGQYEFYSALWQVDLGGSTGEPRQVTPEGSERQGQAGLDVLRDGSVVFSSIAAGDNDIWLVRSDGTGRRQITTGPGHDSEPAATPDDKRIVFCSDRSGITALWVVSVDGSGLRQLTGGEDYFPAVSPDGKWVYFTRYSGNRSGIWRVSIDGGEPENVIARPSGLAALSPDGAMLACLYQAVEGAPYRVAVLPVEGGEPRATFDLQELWFAGGAGFGWSADGRGLIYVDQEAGVYNLYLQPLDGGRARMLTSFRSGAIFDFALSPDGRTAVCSQGSRTSDVVLITDAR